jgi:hypothetical protein
MGPVKTARQPLPSPRSRRCAASLMHVPIVFPRIQLTAVICMRQSPSISPAAICKKKTNQTPHENALLSVVSRCRFAASSDANRFLLEDVPNQTQANCNLDESQIALLDVFAATHQLGTMHSNNLSDPKCLCTCTRALSFDLNSSLRAALEQPSQVHRYASLLLCSGSLSGSLTGAR